MFKDLANKNKVLSNADSYFLSQSQSMRLARIEAQKALKKIPDATLAQMGNSKWTENVSNIAKKTYDKFIAGDYIGQEVFKGRIITEPQITKALKFTEETFKIGKQQPLKMGLDLLDKQTVNYLQDYHFGLIQRVSDDIKYGIKGSVLKGIGIGESEVKITERIKNYITEPFPVYYRKDLALVEAGVKNIEDCKVLRVLSPEYRSKMIAKTESMRGFNQGSLSRYKETGVSMVIIDHQAGECSICAEDADNSPYDVNDCPYLPEHPWCQHSYRPDPESILNKDLRDFEDLDSITGVPSPEEATLSGLEGVGNDQLNAISNLMNTLPQQLQTQDFFSEGTISSVLGNSVNRVDGRLMEVGEELIEDNLNNKFLTNYFKPYFYRYKSELPKGVTMERFSEDLKNYSLGYPIKNKFLYDFIDLNVFRNKKRLEMLV